MQAFSVATVCFGGCYIHSKSAWFCHGKANKLKMCQVLPTGKASQVLPCGSAMGKLTS